MTRSPERAQARLSASAQPTRGLGHSLACESFPVCPKIFSSSLGLYPLDVSSPLPVVTTMNVFGLCRGPLGVKITRGREPLELGREFGEETFAVYL